MVNRSEVPKRCPRFPPKIEVSAQPVVGSQLSYSQTLPRQAPSAAVARRVATSVLTAWSLQDLVDDAQLVLGELVTNAVDHAVGVSIQLSVTRTAERRIRVAVSDMDRRRPSPRAADPLDERGRGLLLVADLSERWGVDPLPGGKTAWSELVAP